MAQGPAVARQLTLGSIVGQHGEPTSRNRGLRMAYRLGHTAGATAECAANCPYRDHRTARGGVTWSRAYIRAWHDGWEDGRAAARQSST